MSNWPQRKGNQRTSAMVRGWPEFSSSQKMAEGLWALAQTFSAFTCCVLIKLPVNPHRVDGMNFDHLDVIYESAEPLSQSKALEKVNDLRERERKAFEAVITNHAREIFDAD